MTKKIILSISLLAIMATAFSTPVSADEVEQSQSLSQDVEVECTTSGTYGQNTNCKVNASQEAEQNQRVKILGVYHDASKVDAGLDSKMTILFATIMLAGFASTAVLAKSRISK